MSKRRCAEGIRVFYISSPTRKGRKGGERSRLFRCLFAETGPQAEIVYKLDARDEARETEALIREVLQLSF